MSKALLNMPNRLQQRIIGTTINYILFEQKKSVGFITQEVIEELFKEFTGVSLNDACEKIDTTFKDFVDLHFSSAFKNCHPHGLARNEVVNKSILSFDSFGGFGVQAAAFDAVVSSLPTAIGNNAAANTPLTTQIDAAAGDAATSPLKLEPTKLFWSKPDGIQNISLLNQTTEHQAIKVKCSDNDVYRVSPVRAIIEPGKKLNIEIQRQNGSNKDARIFIVYSPAGNEENPKNVFKSDMKYPMIVLSLLFSTKQTAE
uniref:Major sperm protein n=1 Tax=Panagrolaimus davidi TaxID=227884 RepID=A0A914QYJ6_9BILA